jgi:hypothetical protein
VLFINKFDAIYLARLKKEENDLFSCSLKKERIWHFSYSFKKLVLSFEECIGICSAYLVK